MTRPAALFLGLIGTTLLFGWFVPFALLAGGLQPTVVALSIMAAAVLVRLNRGMPTLDWKSLEVVERGRLTQAIVELTEDYLWVLAFLAAAAIYVVGLMTAAPLVVALPKLPQMMLVSLATGLLYECAVRMSYVVWRDYDIVKLQKHLIDASGVDDHQVKQDAAADEKVAAMKASGLRAPSSKPPAAWN